MPLGGLAGALHATHRRALAALEGPPPLALVLHDDLGGEAATSNHLYSTKEHVTSQRCRLFNVLCQDSVFQY